MILQGSGNGREGKFPPEKKALFRGIEKIQARVQTWSHRCRKRGRTDRNGERSRGAKP